MEPQVIRCIVDAEDGERGYFWMVAWDTKFYTCRIWKLTPRERRNMRAWAKFMTLRKQQKLALLPPPDIDDVEPMEGAFIEIEHAYAFFAGGDNPELHWHATQMFSELDPVRFRLAP